MNRSTHSYCLNRLIIVAKTWLNDPAWRPPGGQVTLAERVVVISVPFGLLRQRHSAA